MINGLDHIAVAVPDLEEAITVWEKTLGGRLVHREIVEEQGVEAAMIMLGNLKIELLKPLSEGSGVAKFLEKKGSGIHHIALNSSNAQMELDRMKSVGARLIDEKVRTGAENTLIGFLHPRTMGGVLVEIVEHKKE